VLTGQGQWSGEASGIQSSDNPGLRVTYISAVTSRLAFLTQLYFSVRGIQFDYTMLTYHYALKPFQTTQDIHSRLYTVCVCVYHAEERETGLAN